MITNNKVKLSLWKIPLDYRFKSIKPKIKKKVIDTKETEKEVEQ
jgi:hypothetical protein